MKRSSGNGSTALERWLQRPRVAEEDGGPGAASAPSEVPVATPVSVSMPGANSADVAASLMRAGAERVEVEVADGGRVVATKPPPPLPAVVPPKKKTYFNKAVASRTGMPTPVHGSSVSPLRFADFIEPAMEGVGDACFEYLRQGTPLARKGGALRGAISEAVVKRFYATELELQVDEAEAGDCVNGTKRGKASERYDFGIVDSDGTWITPNQVLALALYHLKKNRGWTGAVVRTVPTSHQVDSVAEMLGVKLYETPVGFKYIGALMESEPIICGGEESGGLSVKGHVPEKDGILACLLMAELVATERKSLGAILKRIEKGTGQAFFTERINVAVAEQSKAALIARLKVGFEKIGSSKVEQFITTDGWKFVLAQNEWVAFRASGTEPVFRCYIEAKSEQRLAKLRIAAKKLLKV